MLTVFLASVAALLPITNPLGALAAYAGLTSTMPPADVKAQAWRTGMYVFGILAVFAAIGSLVLHALGITLPSLQIAGGLVVMHSGFSMISPRESFSPEEKAHAGTKTDISFSPMALPLVAGPGAIGVVIALGSRYSTLADRGGVVLASLVIAALVAVALRFGTPLVDKLGPTGIGALTRVIGFLILAIGVELVTHGVLAVVHS